MRSIMNLLVEKWIEDQRNVDRFKIKFEFNGDIATVAY